MFTVTEFLKHKCIREFLSEETKIRSDNNDAMMITDAAAGTGGEDELKEKEEENLSYYEMGNLLTCPSCDQFFDTAHLEERRVAMKCASHTRITNAPHRGQQGPLKGGAGG